MNNITGDSIGKLVYNSISRSVIEKSQYSLKISVRGSVFDSITNEIYKYEFKRRDRC